MIKEFGEKMEVKIINKSKDGMFAQLLVKGATPALLNSFRRTAMARLLTLAIEDIRMYDNNSIMIDEMLANRLGLLVIRGGKTIEAEDEAKFGLEKEGPGTVYSQDIKPLSGKAEIVHENVPLVKLMKGQRVKMELIAKAGNGRQHAKFQPANIGYQHVFDIKIGKPDVHPEKVSQANSTLYETKAGKLVVADVYACDGSNALAEVFPENEITVTPKPEDFILTIESFGQFSAEEILENTIALMRETNEAFKKSVGGM